MPLGGRAWENLGKKGGGEEDMAGGVSRQGLVAMDPASLTAFDGVERSAGVGSSVQGEDWEEVKSMGLSGGLTKKRLTDHGRRFARSGLL